MLLYRFAEKGEFRILLLYSVTSDVDIRFRLKNSFFKFMIKTVVDIPKIYCYYNLGQTYEKLNIRI